MTIIFAENTVTQEHLNQCFNHFALGKEKVRPQSSAVKMQLAANSVTLYIFNDFVKAIANDDRLNNLLQESFLAGEPFDFSTFPDYYRAYEKIVRLEKGDSYIADEDPFAEDPDFIYAQMDEFESSRLAVADWDMYVNQDQTGVYYQPYISVEEHKVHCLCFTNDPISFVETMMKMLSYPDHMIEKATHSI